MKHSVNLICQVHSLSTEMHGCSISHTDWPILFFSRTGKMGTHVKRLNEHLTRLRTSREVKKTNDFLEKDPNEILMIINVFKWNTCSRRSALLHHQCNYSHRNMWQINELWQHILQLLQLAFSKYSPVHNPFCSKTAKPRQAVCNLVILNPGIFGTDIFHEK